MTETTQTNQHSLVAQLRSHLRMPLYRNGYILTLNAIVTSGLGLVYWILATRYYNSATVGINSALLAAVTLLSGGAQLSLNSAMVRFIPVAGRATLRLVGYVYLVTSMFAAIAGLVFGISAGAWSPTLRFLSQHPVWLSLFVISTLAWCIFSLQDSVMTGLRQPVWILVENGVYGLVKIVLLIIFATRMPDYGIFASWLIPIMLSLFPVNALIFRRLIPIHAQADNVQPQPVHLHQILRYVSGNYPAWLFYLASTTLLPIIVADQAGARASAYFYLPWMITNSLQLVVLNMALSLTVEATVDLSRLQLYCYRVLVHATRMVGTMVVVICLAAPIVLRIFGSEYAQEGSTLMRLLALAAIPDIFITIYLSFARVRNQPGAVLLVHGSLSMLTLGLSYVLLAHYGITGVGIAYLAAQTSVALVLLLTQLFPVLQRGRALHVMTGRNDL